MVDERTEPTDAPTAVEMAPRRQVERTDVTPSSLELVTTPHFVARPRSPRDNHDNSGNSMEARIRERLLGIPAAVQRVGRFRVIREIGRGGSGRVLECHDEALDRTIAVKLLRDAGRSASVIRREAMAIARVQHPRVVHVYEVGEHEGRMFLAMQMVRGRPLREVQRGGLLWHEVLRLYIAAGRGLAAAHVAGIIHRDFKADNVVVDREGNPYVVDFGLAQPSPELEPELAAITRSHRSRIPGTPSYMAPEQLAEGIADARTDQFAFAASLFEAVFGAPAYRGATPFELAQSMVAHAIHRPSPDHPAVLLHTALARALAYKPGDRWASLGDLLAALEQRLVQRDTETRTRPTAPSSDASASRSHRVAIAAAVAVGLAALAGLSIAVGGW